MNLEKKQNEDIHLHLVLDYQVYLLFVLLQVDRYHVPAEAIFRQILGVWQKVYEVLHNPKAGGDTAKSESRNILAIYFFEFLIIFKAKKDSFLGIEILILALKDLV